MTAKMTREEVDLFRGGALYGPEWRNKICDLALLGLQAQEQNNAAGLPVDDERELMGMVHYQRVPSLDKRIARGDDFAGDAWVRWTAVGHKPDNDPPAAPDSTPQVPQGLGGNDVRDTDGSLPSRLPQPARVELAVSEEALRLANEFVADPDARAQVKVQLAMQHGMAVSDMIDEAVVMARELLRLNEALPQIVRDAERYQWLRSEEVCTEPRYYGFWNEFIESKLIREKEMDKLIDSARGAK